MWLALKIPSKIYISQITFHMGVKSVICFFSGQGVWIFWWTLGGSQEFIHTFLPLFFFFHEFLLWCLVSREFNVFTNEKQKKNSQQSTRLVGLTIDFRNTDCFSWVFFCILLNYILFNFCGQKWTRGLSATVFKIKYSCPLEKKEFE